MKWEDRRRSSNVTRSGGGSIFGRASRNTNSYQRSPKGRRGGRMPIPIPIPTGGRRRRGGIGGGGIGCVSLNVLDHDIHTLDQTPLYAVLKYHE